MSRKRNRGGRLGPRISYRPTGIAPKTPGLQSDHTHGRSRNPAAVSPLGNRGHRSRRQNSSELPPPCAGVSGLRFPICTDLRIPSLPTAVAEGQ